MIKNKPHRETELLYMGEKLDRNDVIPESMPIYQTTSYLIDDLDDLFEKYENGGYTYSRLENPNRTALADTMTYLEGGTHSLIFSSCMGAISVGILTVVKAGDHVLANSKLYGETMTLLSEILADYGVTVSFADFGDLDAVRRELRPNTKLLYTEILSNPLLDVTDLAPIAEIAHQHNAKVMVDNTFTTPLLVKPLHLGADLVANSLTKSLNGHFDVTAGSLTVKDKCLMDRAQEMVTLFGSVCDPNSAWLALRGIRTAELRIMRQNDNACKLAKALQQNPHVQKVFHPSLPDHPNHDVAVKQLRENCFGSILSIELEDSYESMNTFIGNLELVKYANTLGGYRTTVSHPCSASHYHIDDAVRRSIGIHPGVLRISCGIEAAEDLIADFERALDKTFQDT